MKDHEAQRIDEEVVADLATRSWRVEKDTLIVEGKSVERVVVAARGIELINNLIATSKPACEREVEVKRKVKNLSQG